MAYSILLGINNFLVVLCFVQFWLRSTDVHFFAYLFGPRLSQFGRWNVDKSWYQTYRCHFVIKSCVNINRDRLEGPKESINLQNLNRLPIYIKSAQTIFYAVPRITICLTDFLYEHQFSFCYVNSVLLASRSVEICIAISPIHISSSDNHLVIKWKAQVTIIQNQGVDLSYQSKK